MAELSNDLDYIIHKSRIGLTSANLLNMSNLYRQLIDENIVDTISEQLNDLPEKTFENIEIIRESLEDNHSYEFMAQIDNIIYRLLNGESTDDLKAQLYDLSQNFTAAAEEIHHNWQNYLTPTILDDDIENLYQHPNDRNLSMELNYNINKANCAILILQKAQNVLDEINLAESDYSHIELAKANYREFLTLNDYMSEGYIHDSKLDGLIYPLIENLYDDMIKVAHYGKEIEALGALDDTVT